QYANWHVTGDVTVGNLIVSGVLFNGAEQTHIVFQTYILLQTPLLILVFFIFKGTLYELFTILAPFILISIILLGNQVYIRIEYYLIFLILALLCISIYAGKKYKIKFLYPIIMATSIINIFTGIFYFIHSSDKEEGQFFESAKKISKWKDERQTSEEYQLASYISDITDETHKILMDDAAAYKIMAHLRSLKNVISPINNNFITVVENPRSGARFVCVAKSENELRAFTVLNNYNIRQMELRKEFHPLLMYETKNWAIYKIL
ncbi:MAG: hypothetical protein KGL19_12970, partial [Bacteroidota bacterium]|nr:hypothetical protein [Bacteroidota bacterium]